MSLTAEWRDRIVAWKRELKTQFYTELGELSFEAFFTFDQLPADEAAGRSFEPVEPGTRWGEKWQYGWFRATTTLDERAAGKRIVTDINLGGEALVYVNGVARGARDGARNGPTLTRKAAGGETFELLLEAYAGHGPTPSAKGPVPPERNPTPHCPDGQWTVGRSTCGVWNELAYQLWLDVETLHQVRDALDADSLRVMEIDRALRDFTTIVDFELDPAGREQTYRAARERLRPLLECVNGSTAPTMFAFGHAHLDVAWLWPLAETERKAARTLTNQLALAEEYPEYRFLHSQPHLYRMVAERYPAVYERVKKAVADGQIIADGGMWVEADTNVSGGEALIRQFLHGKRFFREEFGVASELLWLPDVFGYSGALPQIMRGCGIRFFATAKIYWAYHSLEVFPLTTFRWEGIDGSDVLVNLCNNYNATTEPSQVISRWRERPQKDGYATRLFPFGWGDGGGGPTRDHLEFLRREVDIEGVPRTRMAAPMEYFEDQESRETPLPRYVGELYYATHRGVYTSQAKTKRGNRKSELALREAEMWAVADAALNGASAPADELDAAWKAVLLNQFHDILPGSSIARVYEEANAAYDETIAAAGGIADAARGGLVGEGDGLVVFNSLSWPRTELVELPEGIGAATNDEGKPLSAQEVEGRTLVEASVPPCGWTTIRPTDSPAPSDDAPPATAADGVLENEHVRVELNERGEIVRLLDKAADREMAAGPGNVMRMFKDVPSQFDAWDIDSMYPLTPVELDGPAEIETFASGPLLAGVRVRRTLNDSPMTQDIVLRRDSRRVDFVTRIDWRESHKLLKVAFPVGVHAREALHEIQFGHIARPTHRSRDADADRFEVCNHKWTALVDPRGGAAVLNDCKYGVDVLGNCISLTLLRSPLAPDPAADKGMQEFTCSLMCWDGDFADAGLVREGYRLNCPIATAAGDAGERSLWSVDAPNVVVETVKPAADGGGDVIVRLYESLRTPTRCTLRTELAVVSAVETDMLENPGDDLPCDDGAVELSFRPFEIKTVRLTPGG